jgi:hypothetical protein
VVQCAVDHCDGVTGEVDSIAVDGGADDTGAGGGLQPGQAGTPHATRPVGGEGGVGAARDRVLGNALGWCEEARDEVVVGARVRRRGGGDHPADAVPEGQGGKGGEVGP